MWLQLFFWSVFVSWCERILLTFLQIPNAFSCLSWIEMQRALMALFQLFSLEKAAEYLLEICVQNSAHIGSEFWPKNRWSHLGIYFQDFYFQSINWKFLWIKFQIWLHKVFNPIVLRSWLTSFQIRNSYFSHPSVVFLVGTIAAHNGFKYFLKEHTN